MIHCDVTVFRHDASHKGSIAGCSNFAVTFFQNFANSVSREFLFWEFRSASDFTEDLVRRVNSDVSGAGWGAKGLWVSKHFLEDHLGFNVFVLCMYVCISPCNAM